MSEIAPWTIETTNNTVTADWLDGQLFDTAPGTEITVRFAFVSWGVDDTPSGRHEELQAFVDAAVEDVTVRTGTTRQGRPYYREDLAAWSVDSLLVRLQPADSTARGGVWAVLTGGSDATPAVEDDVFVWELEGVVLTRETALSRGNVVGEYDDSV